MKKRIFVVSCQALKDEPLFGKGVMVKMAQAALVGGADWIRTSQLNNVKAMMKKFDVPIIGLIKKNYANSEIHITPSLCELKKLVYSGVGIIAVDATRRSRPAETLEEMVRWFHQNKFNNQKLMADCSSLDEIKYAIKLKFDFIGTTLVGYTKATKNKNIADNNFEILKIATKITRIPIVAEGRIDTPQKARRAFEAGANIVVVGSAITRPRIITKSFLEEIKKGETNDNKS